MSPARAATVLAGLLAAPGGAQPGESMAPVRHLDCAVAYRTLGLALPYLPGIAVMFGTGPRSGHATAAYLRSLGRDAAHKRFAESTVRQRTRAALEEIEAGALSVASLRETVDACNAAYGFDPIATTLDELEEKWTTPRN